MSIIFSGTYIPKQDFHRKHGLQLPLDIMQIMTWLLIIFPLVTNFVFLIRIMDPKSTYFFMSLFCLFYFLGLSLFIYVSFAKIPEDVCQQSDFTHRCRFCQKFVRFDSKHCRLCNQCRKGFDHHCRFLNQCITQFNYNPFFYWFTFRFSIIFGLYSFYYFLRILFQWKSRISVFKIFWFFEYKFNKDDFYCHAYYYRSCWFCNFHSSFCARWISFLLPNEVSFNLWLPSWW